MIANRKLKAVNNPSRYLGGEMGMVIKSKQDIRIALLIPTVYEEAMTNNSGIQLYNNINSKMGLGMERIFTPMPDFESILRRENINLTTIETETNLKDVQIILVLLDDVMQITNALNTLNLAKIPVLNARRDDTFPLIIFAGKAMLNPKPFIKFADCIVIGEVENVIENILDIYLKSKDSAKQNILSKMDELFFIYTSKNLDKELTYYIKEEFEYVPYKKYITPSISKGLDINITTIFKGNNSKGYLSQEKYVYKTPIEKINPIFEIKDKIQKTGERKISIDTKNLLDFDTVRDIIYEVQQDNELKNSKIQLLNVDLNEDNLWTLQYIDGKKNILLENKYNKKDVLVLAKNIFGMGYSDIKLKYIIGQNKENYEDLNDLIDLAEDIVTIYLQMYPNSSKTKILDLELIPFLPLIHTPFEWSEMNSPEKLELKIRYVKERNKNQYIDIFSYDTYRPCIKTMILRGDIDTGNIVYDAWKNGAKLDNYEELFRKEPWEIALNRNKRTLKSFLEKLDENEVLPWDNVKVKTSKEELIKIYESEIKHRDENNSDK